MAKLCDFQQLVKRRGMPAQAAWRAPTQEAAALLKARGGTPEGSDPAARWREWRGCAHTVFILCRCNLLFCEATLTMYS
jgi:hypothetical protein